MNCLQGTAMACHKTGGFNINRVIKYQGAKKICILLLSFYLLLLNNSIYSQNNIVTENALAGAPATEWDIAGAGDPSIQGFSTELSVNKGETVFFKIKTDALAYTIKIYRIGYYRGNGARFVANGSVTAALPQIQPDGVFEPATGKFDCGNWNVSGRWVVPTTAVSGVYIAKLTRNDNGGSSHIIFIVRDDAQNSKLLYKTSDATWQAYNNYGGNALYGYVSSIPVPTFTQSVKVSYNRPFNTRGGNIGLGVRESFFFNAEYAMIRWLERNGYEMSYTTQIDIARRTTPFDPAKYKVLLSVGHDEYWSAEERDIYTAARNAGVNLAFFSGNEIFWKTRWEDNYRTLVCYKESETPLDIASCGGKCDPMQDVWTGLWRAGCTFPNADGCRPENELSGQLSAKVSTSTITVPSVYKKLRFWRNTSIATMADGQSVSLTPKSLGYEWDQEQASTTYPAGRIVLSKTQVGADVHKMSLYRHSSRALVFASGTINWSYGLDGTHDISPSVEDANMQQATVNLLADMGVQPGSLQTNLIAATTSTDVNPPASTINPIAATVTPVKGQAFTISGTATDVGGGVVGGVEISTDGGVSWVGAEGIENWTYAFTPLFEGEYTIIARSFDDLGNIETITAANSIKVKVLPSACPCKIFKDTDVPERTVLNETTPVEIGVKFKSLIPGKIAGIRYYKGAGQTGVKTASLWKKTGPLTGDLIGTAVFNNETAVGWQQILFTTPVDINANETYVASIFSPTGDYNVTRPGLQNSVISTPLVALADGEDGGNGVYNVNAGYPAKDYEKSNYWVDVVFNSVQSSTLPVINTDPLPVSICSNSPASFTAAATGATNVQWQFSLNNLVWTNIPGATAATYTFTADADDNGTYYRAAFSNAAGTVYTNPATLSFSKIIATVSSTGVTCIGNNGSITVNATGGQSPYTYSINNGAYQTSSTFSNLVGDIYNVTVKDNTSCSTTISNINIGSSTSLNVSLQSKIDVGCVGTSGSITVSATGGTAPYAYSLDEITFQSSNVFANLAPGTYNVLIKDAGGCTAKLSSVVITLKAQISLVVASKTDATCSANNGTIAVTATLGSEPYTYSKDGTTFQTSNIFNNLAAGTYTIVVKDALGCRATTSVTINRNNALDITLLSKTDVTCGLTDGKISVAGSCGVAPYRYVLSTGKYQTSGTFTNLDEGTYDVYVVDALSNVEAIKGIVISEIKTLTLSASKIVNETCTNADGSVTLTAAGGKTPYQFKQGAGTYRTSNIFTGLKAGAYSFTVKDANGCITTISATVVSAPSNLTLAVTASADATCVGGDGFISVNATGGSGSYTYNINGGTYQTGKTFTSLKEGTYVVTVKDSKGCIATIAGIVLKRTQFIATVTSTTNISCKGSDGSITMATTGGTAPYLYSINGGKYDDASKVLQNLKAGTYYVAVKDSRNCISVVNNIVLINAPAITATLAKTNACQNINNGTITVTAVGGIPPYQYSLNGGTYKTSNVFTNLAPGVYSVRVKDSKSCTSVLYSVTLTRTTVVCSGRNENEGYTKAGKANDKSISVVEEKPGLLIYPNPARGNVRLELKGLNTQKTNISVVDALGKEVYKFATTINANSITLPLMLPKLAQGVYFVRVNTRTVSLAEKLIIY